MHFGISEDDVDAQLVKFKELSHCLTDVCSAQAIWESEDQSNRACCNWLGFYFGEKFPQIATIKLPKITSADADVLNFSCNFDVMF